ncbi:hypothetical protein ABT150_30270 [Streptomyces mirabilis]|uniref:hypothetical protein n=1 Tax=Streptomyces mirabilis TaxID=68239 RepID=UPI003324C5FC
MPERTQTAFPASGLLSKCLDRSEEPDCDSPDGSADVTPAAPTTHQAPSLKAETKPVELRLAEELEPDDLVEPEEDTKLVTARERCAAVSSWLLTATEDRTLGRKQWAEGGIALLSCGGVFSAIRIPGLMVWAVAGTDELTEVDVFLSQALDGGPVFMDLHSNLYYLLVPGSFSWRWNDRDFPGVECLGQDHFLGVPDIRLTVPRGRSYWCVPMNSPGELCNSGDAERFVGAAHRARQVEGARR